MKTIYLDNNATTRVADEVFQEMLPFFKEQYGNPSSVYQFGSHIAKKIEQAREQVAAFLGCKVTEVVFTSGGTESNNTAIRGVLAAHPSKKHIITTEVEHHAILNPLTVFERQGYEITRLPVDSEGRLDLEDLTDAIGDDTALVTIMHANNETGVLFPMEEISSICQERGVAFHCDGIQAVGKVPIHLNESGVDLYSVSGHKIHGPKGIGMLYIRRGLKFRSLIQGGHQERGRRGGTENVPGIIGFGQACVLAQEKMGEESLRVAALRDRLEQGILGSIPCARVNGGESPRLPNTTNIRYEGIESEAILISLDEIGVCASPGSACMSGTIEPSHVLRAMGQEEQQAASAVRFSLSRYTTQDEIDFVLENLPPIIKRLEGLSPYAKQAIRND